jgi:hypothetical protein
MPYLDCSRPAITIVQLASGGYGDWSSWTIFGTTLTSLLLAKTISNIDLCVLFILSQT